MLKRYYCFSRGILFLLIITTLKIDLETFSRISIIIEKILILLTSPGAIYFGSHTPGLMTVCVGPTSIKNFNRPNLVLSVILVFLMVSSVIVSYVVISDLVSLCSVTARLLVISILFLGLFGSFGVFSFPVVTILIENVNSSLKR